MNINNRLCALRKNGLNMTMESFGKIIGISKSGVSEIESGRRSVTDKHIRLLCSSSIEGKFVSESWLRTGNGEMFVEKTQDQELQIFADKIMQDTPKSFRRRYVTMLSKLSDEQWKLLSQMVDMLLTDADACDKKSGPKTLFEMTDQDIDEEGRKYADRLREEKARMGRSSFSKGMGEKDISTGR